MINFEGNSFIDTIHQNNLFSISFRSNEWFQSIEPFGIFSPFLLFLLSLAIVSFSRSLPFCLSASLLSITLHIYLFFNQTYLPCIGSYKQYICRTRDPIVSGGNSKTSFLGLCFMNVCMCVLEMWYGYKIECVAFHYDVVTFSMWFYEFCIPFSCAVSSSTLFSKKKKKNSRCCNSTCSWKKIWLVLLDRFSFRSKINIQIEMAFWNSLKFTFSTSEQEKSPTNVSVLIYTLEQGRIINIFLFDIDFSAIWKCTLCAPKNVHFKVQDGLKYVLYIFYFNINGIMHSTQSECINKQKQTYTELLLLFFFILKQQKLSLFLAFLTLSSPFSHALWCNWEKNEGNIQINWKKERNEYYIIFMFFHVQLVFQ